jgi:hypothetical protein
LKYFRVYIVVPVEGCLAVYSFRRADCKK